MNKPVEKDEIDLKAQKFIREVRSRTQPLDDNELDLIFNSGRSFNGWTDEPVSEEQIRKIFDLMKQCPTSSNCCPLRIKFVMSDEAKEKLGPVVNEPNRVKTLKAPVTAILGTDHDFHEHFKKLVPFRAEMMEKRFAENPDMIVPWANLNGALQAAYFMMAVRSVGLDVGPMQGINKPGMDGAFWAGTNVKTMFICSFGRGDETTVFKKLPRFDFDEACEIV